VYSFYAFGGHFLIYFGVYNSLTVLRCWHWSSRHCHVVWTDQCG